MDARLFSRMLTELLCSREQAVLTGFGTFHAELVPAYFSDKGFTLNPPYLKVCFRGGDDSDDSLARLYSASNGIELAVARTVINDYVASIRRELSQNKVFALPGLGRLRYISRDNVFFIPDEGLSLFPGYDSLEAISIKSLSSIPEPQPSESDQSASTVLTAIPEPQPSESAQLPAADQPVSTDVTEAPGSAAAVQSVGEDTAKGSGKRVPLAVKLLLALVITAAVLLGALALAGRFFPDIVDPWLYSPEELKIIRYKF